MSPGGDPTESSRGDPLRPDANRLKKASPASVAERRSTPPLPDSVSRVQPESSITRLVGRTANESSNHVDERSRADRMATPNFMVFLPREYSALPEFPHKGIADTTTSNPLSHIPANDYPPIARSIRQSTVITMLLCASSCHSRRKPSGPATSYALSGNPWSRSSNTSELSVDECFEHPRRRLSPRHTPPPRRRRGVDLCIVN